MSAEQVRQLAHKRIRLALLTLPSCLLVGAAVLLIFLNLALVAVLCGFFAYACITIAKRQRDTVKAAADFEVAVSGNQFHAAARSPRQIFMAVQRPDYLRLVLTRERVSALWLDNRRNLDVVGIWWSRQLGE